MMDHHNGGCHNMNNDTPYNHQDQNNESMENENKHCTIRKQNVNGKHNKILLVTSCEKQPQETTFTKRKARSLSDNVSIERRQLKAAKTRKSHATDQQRKQFQLDDIDKEIDGMHISEHGGCPKESGVASKEPKEEARSSQEQQQRYQEYDDKTLADRRAANRLAAKKSRQRRKNTINQLQTTVNELQTQKLRQAQEIQSLTRLLHQVRTQNQRLNAEITAMETSWNLPATITINDCRAFGRGAGGGDRLVASVPSASVQQQPLRPASNHPPILQQLLGVLKSRGSFEMNTPPAETIPNNTRRAIGAQRKVHELSRLQQQQERQSRQSESSSISPSRTWPALCSSLAPDVLHNLSQQTLHNLAYQSITAAAAGATKSKNERSFRTNTSDMVGRKNDHLSTAAARWNPAHNRITGGR